jgi:hypothetical protein
LGSFKCQQKVLLLKLNELAVLGIFESVVFNHIGWPIKSISAPFSFRVVLLMKTIITASNTNFSDHDIEPVIRSTRALFVAILSRALKDIFRPAYDDYDLYKKQALHWIEINDLESFTSFINICNYLDIDADRVRRSVYIEMGKVERDTES